MDRPQRIAARYVQSLSRDMLFLKAQWLKVLKNVQRLERFVTSLSDPNPIVLQSIEHGVARLLHDHFDAARLPIIRRSGRDADATTITMLIDVIDEELLVFLSMLSAQGLDRDPGVLSDLTKLTMRLKGLWGRALG